MRPIIWYLKEIDESDGGVGAITLNAQDIAAAEKMLLSVRKTLGRDMSPPLRGELTDILEFCSLFKSKDRRYIFHTEKDEKCRAALTATIADHTEMLRDALWRASIPAILTSGTLAVGNDFSRFRDDAGLKPLSARTIESISLSPFDYQKNCLLHIPKTPVFKPGNAGGYYDEISDIIGNLIKITTSHTLLLFNSYAAMTSVYERLKAGGMNMSTFVMKRNHPTSGASK